VERETQLTAEINDLDAVRNRPDQGVLVELTGFEPVIPSLRTMQSNLSDQGKQHRITGLWGGCGASDVRQCEVR
jgi:hypothetical protein